MSAETERIAERKNSDRLAGFMLLFFVAVIVLFHSGC